MERWDHVARVTTDFLFGKHFFTFCSNNATALGVRYEARARRQLDPRAALLGAVGRARP